MIYCEVPGCKEPAYTAISPWSGIVGNRHTITLFMCEAHYDKRKDL